MEETHFDKLPLEILVEIINYCKYSEVLWMTQASKHLQKAIGLSFKWAISDLKQRISKKICQLQANLLSAPMSEDFYRLDTVRAMVCLRFIQSEFGLLFVTVWRYSKVPEAWSRIIPKLVNVLEEFSSVVDKCNIERSESVRYDLNILSIQTNMPRWIIFIENFDEFSESLRNITSVIPFEVRVADILSCCPSCNFQMGIETNEDEYSLYCFAKFQFLKPTFQVPIINSSTNLDGKLKTLLKYILSCIKYQNGSYLQTILNEIIELEGWLQRPALSPQDRVNFFNQLQVHYSRARECPYSCWAVADDEDPLEFYSRCTTYNVPLTGVTCIVQNPSIPISSLPFLVLFKKGSTDLFGCEVVESDDDFTFDQINFFTEIQPERSLRECNSDTCVIHNSALPDHPALETDIDHPDIDENVMRCDGPLLPVLPPPPGNIYRHLLQLTIHFHEGFNSSPAEAIISLFEDDNQQKNVSFYTIHSEPHPVTHLYHNYI